MDDNLTESVYQDGQKYFETIFEKLNKHFKQKFNRTIESYIGSEFETIKYGQNISLKVTAVIQLILTNLINSDAEAQYMQLFNQIENVETQTDAEQLKNFFEKVLSSVDNPELYDSIAMHFDKNLVDSRLKMAKTIEDYQRLIEQAEHKLENKRNEIFDLMQKNKKLNQQVNELQKINEQVTLELAENKDLMQNQTQQEIKDLKQKYEVHIQKLQKKLDLSKMNTVNLQKELQELKQNQELVEEDNKSYMEQISNLGEKYVDIEKYTGLKQKLYEVQKKAMRNENSYLAEKADNENLQQKIKGLRNKYEQQLLAEQYKYDTLNIKFKNLHQKNNNQQMKYSTMTQIKKTTLKQSEKDLPNFNFDNNEIFQENDDDLSDILSQNNADLHRTKSKTTANYDFSNMDKIQQKNNETIKENLKLKEELQKLRMENKSLFTQQSKNDLSQFSRSNSKMSKKSDLSINLTNKAINLEQKLKKYKLKATKLDKKYFDALDYQKQSMNLFYSMLIHSINNKIIVNQQINSFKIFQIYFLIIFFKFKKFQILKFFI